MGRVPQPEQCPCQHERGEAPRAEWLDVIPVLSLSGGCTRQLTRSLQEGIDSKTVLIGPVSGHHDVASLWTCPAGGGR